MSKQSNDCYTDNIKVKISEKYKPPPRINIAVTYAQRLTLNKQIQDNMPNYEFSLEKTVLNKMNQWKNIRTSVKQERTDRLNKAKIHLNQKQQELLEKEQVEEVELKTVNETTTDVGTSCSQPFVTNNQNYANYTNDILVPTQFNILTPIPLQNYNSTKPFNNQDDKSPFNISDFENDTSSPFDNMALKSINDMEELAQVLNKDKKNYEINTPLYSNYPSVRPTSHVQPTYSNYVTNQYSYSIPNQTSPFVQPTRDYSRTNGYFYENNPFQSQYIYAKSNTSSREYYTPQTSGINLDHKKTNCKSVPDIVKAVENDFENTHISTSMPQDSYIQNKEKNTETVRPKSTDAVYPRPKIKKEELDNPYSGLTKTQQDLCKSIVSMGFPLSRVARTCQVLGEDQKKIVDHLLALTDLLDLGFSESDISLALVQCDNDKDKALDKLIS